MVGEIEASLAEHDLLLESRDGIGELLSLTLRGAQQVEGEGAELAVAVGADVVRDEAVGGEGLVDGSQAQPVLE